MDVQQKLEQARKAKKENKALFDRMKKRNPREIDRVVHELHDEVFEEVDCLACANCCKTTSPLMRDRDVDRLAKHLRMKPSAFTDQYVHIDEDGDWVFNGAPCPFLGADNYCSVYEARPNACREYPHTDRKKFRQLFSLTLKNTEVCPAVVEIVERWKAL